MFAQRGRDITTNPYWACILRHNWGFPLVNPQTGRLYYCGRGPTRTPCPQGSRCIVHPTDFYAVCCPGK